MNDEDRDQIIQAARDFEADWAPVDDAEPQTPLYHDDTRFAGAIAPPACPHCAGRSFIERDRKEFFLMRCESCNLLWRSDGGEDEPPKPEPAPSRMNPHLKDQWEQMKLEIKSL